MSPIDGYLKVQANVTFGGRCEKALEGPPRCGHETADRHDKKRRRAGFRRGDSASMADAAEARRVFGATGQGGNLSSGLTKTLWLLWSAC